MQSNLDQGWYSTDDTTAGGAGGRLTREEELKIRAKAESQMLAALLQPGINQAVVLAGELAVVQAKLAEFEKARAESGT